MRAKNYEEALAIANARQLRTFRGGSSRTARSTSAISARTSVPAWSWSTSPTAGVDYHVPFGGTRGRATARASWGFAAVEFYTQIKTVYTGTDVGGGMTKPVANAAIYPSIAGKKVIVSGGALGHRRGASSRPSCARARRWPSSMCSTIRRKRWSSGSPTRRSARSSSIATFATRSTMPARSAVGSRAARPVRRAGQQRRQRRPARGRGSDARVLGRADGGEPQAPLLRRPGRGPGDEGGRQRLDHQPRLDLVAPRARGPDRVPDRQGGDRRA